jgi:hypothetical protein
VATNPMLDSEKKMIACADLLRKSADQMAGRRMKALKADEITEEQFFENVADEGALRNHVSEIGMKAIKNVLADVQGEQADLEEAIKTANEAIKKIEKIKKALSVFAALIGLAEAIAVGKSKGILSAFKSVRTAAG